MDNGMLLAGCPSCGVGFRRLRPLPRPRATRRVAPMLDVIAPLENSPAYAATAPSPPSTLRWLDIESGGLGFVSHTRMRVESAHADTVAGAVPALAGTVVVSCVGGVLADIYGRRASSCCPRSCRRHLDRGAHAEFLVERRHVFMMGLPPRPCCQCVRTAGGDLPTRHRGLSLVLVGGIGAWAAFSPPAQMSAGC